jgi:hypothetical protein
MLDFGKVRVRWVGNRLEKLGATIEQCDIGFQVILQNRLGYVRLGKVRLGKVRLS